ncbi:hypothetical protein GQ55_3G172200 [Panicum hallii var. hallii]|jgi:hypothetical protein|uniref:Uncharacterized protein n=2 Tax=Panicum hallii TaxID=206008 RepID=A0A2T7EAE3_9POAL|nr:uncharacterized protein LOC112887423 [Panicum hallii]PAN18158.1 hypothetical protein PAHAL_3G182400 [Panicum hallii]PUZ64805.1 hypothetical protein GQ55_3G172200 [Panicum hallii var. hallii]
MAKAGVPHQAGVVALLLCVLLVLSSAVTTAEAARQLGRRDAVVVVTAAATATTATVKGRLGKVMREEMEVDDAVGVGESKRRSPGGPDPQHH